MRQARPPEEKLALTLRYLASGKFLAEKVKKKQGLQSLPFTK